MNEFKTRCKETGLTESKVRAYASSNNLHAGAIIGYFTGDYLESATEQQVDAVADHFYNLAINTNAFKGTDGQFYNNTQTFDWIVNVINK